jgi:ribose transport system substrate-binding protein
VWSAELQETVSVLPTWVVDSADSAEGLLPTDGWPGPDGFQDSFRQLWGVTG